MLENTAQPNIFPRGQPVRVQRNGDGESFGDVLNRNRDGNEYRERRHGEPGEEQVALDLKVSEGDAECDALRKAVYGQDADDEDEFAKARVGNFSRLKLVVGDQTVGTDHEPDADEQPGADLHRRSSASLSTMNPNRDANSMIPPASPQRTTVTLSLISSTKKNGSVPSPQRIAVKTPAITTNPSFSTTIPESLANRWWMCRFR